MRAYRINNYKKNQGRVMTDKATKPIIQINGISKKFATYQAVDNLSLKVSAGEILALLGPNGAGKTTTINCLLGFLTPDSGNVSIAGCDPVTHVSQARSHLAYIPEQVALYPKLSGLENLTYMAKVGGLHKSEDNYRALLTQVNLPERAVDKPLASYSKGMRQKVGIAIALAKKAKALILDEPTSGLDPSASYEFSQLIQGLAADGVAILMATHDLYRAQEDAHSVAILNQGKLVNTLSGKDMRNVDLESLYLDYVRDLL